MSEEDKLWLKNQLQLQDSCKNIGIQENTSFGIQLMRLKEMI